MSNRTINESDNNLTLNQETVSIAAWFKATRRHAYICKILTVEKYYFAYKFFSLKCKGIITLTVDINEKYL